MRSKNTVFLIGNVGNDPETKTLENGTMVATFSMATSKKWKNKEGEVQTKTEWHRLVAWRKVAEIVEKYVTKGKPLHIEGELQTRSWKNKEGETRYSTEIVVEELILLGDGQAHPNEKKETATAGPVNAPQPDEDDDLPF